MGWRGFLGVVAYIALLVILHFSITTFARTHHDTFMAMYPTAMWVLGKLAKATLLAGIFLIAHVTQKVRTGQWTFTPLWAARPGDTVPTPRELESGHGCDLTEAPVDDPKAPIAPIPTVTPAAQDPAQTLFMSIYSFVAFILFLFAMGSYLMIALGVVSLKDKSLVDNVLSFGWAMLEGLEVLFVGVMCVYVGMRVRMLCVRGQ
ncbi:hypothetical protein FB45DRAFT_944418 [Roridomyces roridus]|uniref:Uncharacterized protein n=1 Tax=Roridomyces roridus TaxID=1738132 RepID=A0AAD7B3F0_9AGAR|nr:hypothetical protein FB45DRAFT_944418 [Roridomyces roridus]